MKQPDISNISQMKLPNVNQIGILVKDIPEAVAYYAKLLNIGTWYRSNTVKHETIYRGKPIDVEADIVIAFQGGDGDRAYPGKKQRGKRLFGYAREVRRRHPSSRVYRVRLRQENGGNESKWH